jgi:hypothetical protein
MIRKSILPAVAIGLFLSTPARSAPPQIDGITPYGVQRGVMSEITISGSNLAGNPRLIAPFGFRLDQTSKAAKEDPANGKWKLVVAADTAMGAYPIRVQTDDGISNPFLFVVGQLPQIAEKEDNSTFETAQAIPEPPLVVEGQVAGNDVDFFRFRGRKGQTIVVDAQCSRIGSGIDPTIRLTTASANRTYVASADDSPGLLTDARLSAVLPEDAEYLVELSDSRYQGGARPIYRLVIGAVPMAEEIYPLGGRAGETVGVELRGGSLSGLKIAAVSLNATTGTDLFFPRITSAMLGGAATGSPVLDVESLAPLVVSPCLEVREPADATAPPVKTVAPVVLNGRIDPPGDEDRFVVATTPGQRLRIKVDAYELGSALDGVLRVLGNGGSVLGNADDTNVPQPPKNNQQTLPIVVPDPSLELTVPGGTNEVTLVIRDLENRGGVSFPYRIEVEPIVPDFELVVNDPQISVPRGGTATVGVTIKRKGFSGPITVTVADPPAGLTVRAGSIIAGQNAGVISLSATADASFPAAPIRLVGRAQGSSGPLERLAFSELVFARQTTQTTQQPSLPTCTIVQNGLVAAPALATPVTFDVPSESIEVAHGFGATIPVKVSRSKGSDAALTIASSALPLPPGLTVPGGTVAEKKADGTIAVNAALAAALGTTTIALQAKGKIAGADRVIALPALTLTVVQPALLELAAASIDVKAGTTAELKGKIVRKGAFDGPVTVKINGLPAGLKAEPVTVAKGASSFVVKVEADAKAAATAAGSQVALAFQVEKKDYSVSPTPLPVKVLAAK